MGGLIFFCFEKKKKQDIWTKVDCVQKLFSVNLQSPFKKASGRKKKKTFHLVDRNDDRYECVDKPIGSSIYNDE